jgi:hypothetical protein
MRWTVAVGVDTHTDVHVAVAFDALGVALGSQTIQLRRPDTRICSRGLVSERVSTSPDSRPMQRVTP